MTITSKVYRLYGGILLNATVIDQNAAFAVSPGISEMLLNDGVDNNYVAVGQQDPRIRITTTAIAAALASAGLSGYKVIPTTNEFYAYLRKVESIGTYASGSAHIKLTVKNGLLYPVSISAGNGPDEATLQMELATFWDGTNDPIILASSQALSGSPAVDEAFVAGKVVINGTELEGVQRIDIDFGIQVISRFTKGQVWPVFLAIGRRQPNIRISTIDATALSTFGLTGEAQGATDSLVYLRKVSQNGTRVADATAEHIKFSIDDGLIYVNDLTGDPDTPFQSEVVIKPTWDGTNDVLAISTASAIA